MKKESEAKLSLAKLFYKFALAVSMTFLGHPDTELRYLDSFSYYRHRAEKSELQLNKDDEQRGASTLEHVGIFMMVLQLNKVLEDEWGKGRLQSDDKDIRNISQVVRLIRNAFAHDPFVPVWDISKSAKDKEFEIPGILILKTHDLHGKRVKSEDYGGQLALLRLVDFIENKFRK